MGLVGCNVEVDGMSCGVTIASWCLGGEVDATGTGVDNGGVTEDGGPVG